MLMLMGLFDGGSGTGPGYNVLVLPSGFKMHWVRTMAYRRHVALPK
jgi:hypothetical protein